MSTIRDQRLADTIARAESRAKHEAVYANQQLREIITDMRRAVERSASEILSDDALLQLSADDAWRHLNTLARAFQRLEEVDAGRGAANAKEKAEAFAYLIPSLRHIAAAE